MLINQAFEDFITPWSLSFKKPKLEALYQDSLNNDYLRRFSPFYAVLISVMAISFTTLCLLRCSLNSEGSTEVITIIAYSAVNILSVILELAVNFYVKLKRLRTIPLILATCLAFTIVLSRRAISTSFMLGYSSYLNKNRSLGNLLLVIIGCIYYSPSWIASSVAYTVGTAAWIGCFIFTQISDRGTFDLVVSVLNYVFACWVGPFLIYWAEKEKRRRVFTQWCAQKVCFC